MTRNESVAKRVVRGVLVVSLACSLCSIANPLPALGEELPEETLADVSSTDEALYLSVQEAGQDTQDMFRLYNPNSGEHFYTADTGERDSLKAAGWKYEGVGWVAPDRGNAVYRLYNPVGGKHHYTTSVDERDALLAAGWKGEGVGWYSDPSRRVPLLRLYSPADGEHHYTTDASERDALVAIGWQDEGVGWFAVDYGSPASDEDSGQSGNGGGSGTNNGGSGSGNGGGPGNTDHSGSTIYYWSTTGEVYHNHRCRTVARYESTMHSGSYADMVAAGVAGRRQCQNCMAMDS